MKLPLTWYSVVGGAFTLLAVERLAWNLWLFQIYPPLIVWRGIFFAGYAIAGIVAGLLARARPMLHAALAILVECFLRIGLFLVPYPVGLRTNTSPGPEVLFTRATLPWILAGLALGTLAGGLAGRYRPVRPKQAGDGNHAPDNLPDSPR